MLTWKAHTGPVYDLVFTPDGRQVLSSGVDETVRLWQLADQSKMREWPGSKFWCPLAVSPDGKYIGRGGYGVKCWPTDGETEVIDDDSFTESVAFSPDGNVFVAHGNGGNSLRRWAMPKGKALAGGWGGVRTQASFPTGPLAYSPDGATLAALFAIYNERANRYDSVLFLRDAKTGKELGQLYPAANTSQHATRIVYSPDGTRLAGVYGADLIVWDVAARREVVRQKPSKKHFKGLTFTTDGRHLLTASNDAVIQVWAAPTWQPTTTYAWKVGKLGCVAVSPDGTVAAAGGGTGKVVVWDLE